MEESEHHVDSDFKVWKDSLTDPTLVMHPARMPKIDRSYYDMAWQQKGSGHQSIQLSVWTWDIDGTYYMESGWTCFVSSQRSAVSATPLLGSSLISQCHCTHAGRTTTDHPAVWSLLVYLSLLSIHSVNTTVLLLGFVVMMTLQSEQTVNGAMQITCSTTTPKYFPRYPF
jgi:hypothetical protein